LKNCLEYSGAINARAFGRSIEIATFENPPVNNLTCVLLEDSHTPAQVQERSLITTDTTYSSSSPNVINTLSSLDVSTKWESVPWIQFSQFFEAQSKFLLEGTKT
jgi:hypothetical protein